MILNRSLITYFLLLFGLSLSVINPLHAEELTLAAGFDPGVVVRGDTSYFVISTNQNVKLNYTLPKINGLRFEGPSEQQWVIFKDGKRTVTYRVVYTVKAEKAGEYTLPLFRITAGSEIFKVTERTLSVLDKANGKSSRDLFAELKVGAEKIYVGQAVSFAYAIYIAPGLDEKTIDSFVKINGEGFSEPVFPEALVGEASTEVRYQQRYYSIQWPFLLTALKSGKQDIAFQSDLWLADGTGRQNASGTERHSLKTEDAVIEIFPLPEQGTPKSFSGAIGSFSVKTEVDANEVSIGDPITFRLTVEGEGNFSRITIPVLDLGKNWISRNTGSPFTASDKIGFKGKRVFEYMLIPKDNSITEIPAMAFSFFTPEEGKYKEITVAAIPVKVTGNNIAAQTNSSQEATPEKPAGDGAVPIYEPDLGSGELIPFYSRKIFLWHIPVLGALVFAFIAWQYPRYRDRKHPDFVRLKRFKKSMETVSDQAKKAAEQNDTMALQQSFVKSLQHWVAFFRACAPDSLTDEEVVDELLRSDVEESYKNSAKNAVASLNGHHYGTRDVQKIDVSETLKTLDALHAVLLADVSKKYKTLKRSK